MASVKRIIARRTAARRSAARRAEVRRMIIEQSRIERRKNIATLVVIFLFVMAAAFFIRNYAGDLNFFGLNDRQSIGDPTKLSYTVPTAAATERVQISEKKLSSAICESFGSIKCLEPVVNTFYVNNADTGLRRYEQWIYLDLQNTATSPVTVKAVEFISDKAKNCGIVNLKPFIIGPGQTSTPLEFACVYNTANPGLSADIIVTYTDGVTGYDMTSGATLRIL
jgi:hypothetical protein